RPAQPEDGNVLGVFNVPLIERKDIFGKKSIMMVMKIIILFLFLLWIVHPVSATFNITPQGNTFPVSVGAEIPGAVYVNDIDKDGTGEIVVETYSNLFLYDVSTSTLQSISSLAGALHTITKMPDPNAGNLAGDNKLEIVFGDKTSKKLYAWNSDRTSVAGFPLTLAGNIYSTPALADVDNDGYSEIAIGSDANLVYLVNGDGTIFTNWPVAVGGGVHSQPAFGDIDGDGEFEIVVTALDNKVYAFNIDGSNVSGWPQSISSFGVTFLYNSPAVGDLDNDGTDEVVVSASVIGNLYGGKLIAYNGDGSLLWNAQTYYNAYSSPAIGNIDTDAKNEIVVGCVYSVFAFEHDGTPKWTNPFGENEVYSKPLLKDITGDSISEVFVALKSGTLLGFYGDGTSFMQESSGGNVLGTPSVYDFDNDGSLELIVGTGAGYIQAWNMEFIPVYPSVSLTTPAQNSVFVQGEIISFTGSGSDPDGAIMLGLWSSDVKGGLGSGDLLNVDSSSLNLGYHNISYTVYDRDGLSSTSTITIKIGLKPITSITKPVTGITPLQWTNISFSGTATDQDGSVVGVRWESDRDGLLSNQYTFNSQDLSIGNHIITFTATDNDGFNTSSQIGISIREPKPPICQIIKPITNSEYKVDEIVFFKSSSSDPDGIVETYEWYSSRDGYLGNKSDFNRSDLSPGTHLIFFNVVDNDNLTWTDQITLKIRDETAMVGGGGGGGGFTGEEYTNIEVNEYVTSFVLNDKKITYDFKVADPILSIEYTALRSAGKITSVVEVLHDKSKLVPVPAPYSIYKNVNIFVGLYGYATEQNIRDTTVSFKVKKDWIESNEIDESKVALYRYTDGAWIEQPTELDHKDDTYVYYKTHVKGFFSFAVSGRKLNEEVQTQDGEDISGNGAGSTKDINDSMGGSTFSAFDARINFRLGAGLLALSMICIVLLLFFKKRNN
ncbi:MAG: PGF-pre-PGF domain-containing protein, partial [ANME-2 cluster archaeon]|nr:PGF-pre-PGF domain-containing protein [ANME-2 cluster archaeon]